MVRYRGQFDRELNSWYFLGRASHLRKHNFLFRNEERVALFLRHTIDTIHDNVAGKLKVFCISVQRFQNMNLYGQNYFLHKLDTKWCKRYGKNKDKNKIYTNCVNCKAIKNPFGKYNNTQKLILLFTTNSIISISVIITR